MVGPVWVISTSDSTYMLWVTAHMAFAPNACFWIGLHGRNCRSTVEAKRGLLALSVRSQLEAPSTRQHAH